MDDKAYIALAAATISLGAAIVSSYLSLRSQRRQYFAEMRRWADEACDELSKAVHACDLSPERMGGSFFELRHSLRIAFSALADRGRWFFPNLEHTSVGIEKEAAFTGLRQPALDLLVQAYWLSARLDYSKQAGNLGLRDQFVHIKREFVSVVQDYLDPRERRTVFRRLTSFTGEPPELGRAE